MKRLLLLIALAAASAGSVACSTSTEEPSTADDDLTSAFTGTYVIDSRPFGEYYASRITFDAGKKYEAEITKSSGETQLIAGTYEILPARPNNPQSPVMSDKPTLILGDVSFEYDKLPDGGLRLYHSARHVSFTMKRDPSYRPAPTNAKTISCTGNAVDAKITLDQAQNRRGTLKITRKADADRHDPPSATVAITQTEGGGVPDYLYWEGSSGEQDYYVNMKKAELAKTSGAISVNLRWAEGGQEFDIGGTCKIE